MNIHTKSTEELSAIVEALTGGNPAMMSCYPAEDLAELVNSALHELELRAAGK